ncbi:hypothetical protein [Pseudidiomarina mangrovi]|uniref:hypothetical protein n=1 Tax=Pseudidiomarina mangrovi TaxID=2487133 RepID=UPI000FCC33B7|nr:hypothetical protein [Pseudidiomarina mangrovi]
MKLATTISLAALIFVFSHAAYADDQIVKPISPELYQLDEENQRLVATYKRMFRYYSRRSFSTTRTVRVLLSNYPQHVEAIMYTAFERNPEIYHHLIKAAIDAEPAFTRDIITIALNMGVGEPSEIVKFAVEAEPSYADDIVGTVSSRDDTSLSELIRVAVKVEPQMASSIMQTASQQQPGQIDVIVQTILESVPAMGNYLVSIFTDLIGKSSPDISADERALQRERATQVILGAHRAGIDVNQLRLTAAEYGISDSELEAIIKQ